MVQAGRQMKQAPQPKQHMLVSSQEYAWVTPVLTILTCLVLGLAGTTYLFASRQPSRAPQRNQPAIELVGSGGVVQVVATPTPGPVATPVNVRPYRVNAVLTWQRTVSRLETKEFDLVADAVAPKREGGWFGIGDESIQAHLVGTVIGRTDLSRLTIHPDMASGDITISPDGESISIVLPFPDVSRPIADETQTSFNGHTIGWWTKSDPDLWQAARIEAANMLVEKACEQGIQEKARLEAEEQIKAIFGLGFRNVYVQTRPATRACGL